MANLFVLYIPVEDIESQSLSNQPIEETKNLQKQIIRNNGSSSDITKKLSEQDDENVRTLTENHPFLGSGEVVGRFVKSQSSSNLNNRKDSNPQNSVNNYKDVPGSRFKVSNVSVDHSEDKKTDSKNNKKKVEFNDGDVTVFQEVMTLREFLEDKLSGKMGVINYTWQKTSDDAHWMVTFVVSKDRCDYLYNMLTSWGLGWIPGTSVSVFATSIFKKGVSNEEADNKVPTKSKFNADKAEFMKSIKSSLTVAQVVGDISNNAKLTFDFLILIFLASVIAGLGLGENSDVVLVASMLISPLMGPIIGFTFGMVVRNTQLCLLSFRTELIGLMICLVYGFVFGLITSSIEVTSVNYTVDGQWPTSQMAARGMLRSLWIGVLIALPSGAGVALSILGGNTGSLVGVAISASLLPPVVNAGMLWGLAVITTIVPPQIVPLLNTGIVNLNTTTTFKPPTLPPSPPNCPRFVGNSYKPIYSCSIQQEALIMGCLSLLLAILNILCIFIMGTLVMKIKEISPLPGATTQTASFWKKDLDFYRNTYETIKGNKSTDMANMARTLVSLIKANPKADVKEVISTVKEDQFFRSFSSDPNQLIDTLVDMEEAPNKLKMPVEFKIHDDVYRTVKGKLAKVDRTSSVNERLSPRTFSSFVDSAGTPYKSGGCVVRMRRSQARFSTTPPPAQSFAGGQGDIGLLFNSRTPSSIDEEEEEEVMMDLDWLENHKRKSKYQRQSTSIV